MKYLEEGQFSVVIDNIGIVSVRFRDGVEFSFPTGINPGQVDGDNWHKHGVTGNIPTVNSTITRFIWSPPEVYSKLKFELQDCWMGLRDYPAIEYLDKGLKFSDELGNPVNAGDITQVDLFGPVRHIIDANKMV